MVRDLHNQNTITQENKWVVCLPIINKNINYIPPAHMLHIQTPCEAPLLEADGCCPLSKAVSAHVQTLFMDDSAPAFAHTAGGMIIWSVTEMRSLLLHMV